MAILDKINLDFHIIDTRDPKVLVIMDTSVWGIIEDKVAAIEITIPGSSKVRQYTFIKGKSNVFNSSNLNITPVGERADLADGIYRIDVIGAHGNCKHRDFLKTDKIRLEIAKIYCSLGIEDSQENRDVKKVIQDIELLIKASEILTTRGELKKAMYFLSQAVKDVNDYNECKDCK